MSKVDQVSQFKYSACTKSQYFHFELRRPKRKSLVHVMRRPAQGNHSTAPLMMADTTANEATLQQLATQAPPEAVQPHPPAHESHAAEKHALDNDATDALPHKRYRSEPHHSVLLTNETEKTAVVSPSQYVPDFLKSKSALSIIPEEERGSIFI